MTNKSSHISFEKIIAYKRGEIVGSDLIQFERAIERDPVIQTIVDEFDSNFIEDYIELNAPFADTTKKRSFKLPHLPPKVLLTVGVLILTSIILAVIPYNKIFNKLKKDDKSYEAPIPENKKRTKAQDYGRNAIEIDSVIVDVENEVPIETNTVIDSLPLKDKPELEVPDSIPPLIDSIKLPKEKEADPIIEEKQKVIRDLPLNLFSIKLISSKESEKKKGLFKNKSNDYIQQDIQHITNKFTSSISYEKGDYFENGPRAVQCHFNINKTGGLSQIRYTGDYDKKIEAILQNALFKIGTLENESAYELKYEVLFNYGAK
jgi:hypothetical protein